MREEENDKALFQTESPGQGEEEEEEVGGVEDWRGGEVLSPVSPGVTQAHPHHCRLGVEGPHAGLTAHLQGAGEHLSGQQQGDGGPGDGSPVGERIERSHL